MESKSTFTSRVHVGLDVHKESIAVEVYRLSPDEKCWETVDVGEFRNRPTAIQKMVTAIEEQFGADLHFVYEDGPCGFALLRRLRDMGRTCDMVAPTSIPKRPGDRVKTDRRWIKDQKFEHPATQFSLRKLLEWMESLEHHLRDIERELAHEVENWWLAPLVGSLRALRGVDHLTAIVLLAEIGDFRRFPKAGTFMAYLGLTPSEYTSGGRRHGDLFNQPARGSFNCP